MKKTTLDLYCAFAGWSGGTIHQALNDYSARSMAEKDQFCNSVFDHGLSDVVDLTTFQTFTDARLRTWPRVAKRTL